MSVSEPSPPVSWSGPGRRRAASRARSGRRRRRPRSRRRRSRPDRPGPRPRRPRRESSPSPPPAGPVMSASLSPFALMPSVPIRSVSAAPVPVIETRSGWAVVSLPVIRSISSSISDVPVPSAVAPGREAPVGEVDPRRLGAERPGDGDLVGVRDRRRPHCAPPTWICRRPSARSWLPRGRSDRDRHGPGREVQPTAALAVGGPWMSCAARIAAASTAHIETAFTSARFITAPIGSRSSRPPPSARPLTNRYRARSRVRPWAPFTTQSRRRAAAGGGATSAAPTRRSAGRWWSWNGMRRP